MMRYLLSSFVCLTLAAVGCSVANAPDDPKTATDSATSGPSSSSGGGNGGSGASGSSVGGQGGSGGTGGAMPICGDGMINGDEECDDGGETADCNLDCTKAMCGDNKVNRAAMEECDNGASGDTACGKDCKALAFDIDSNTQATGFGIIFARSKVVVTTGNADGQKDFLVANLRFTSLNPTASELRAQRYSNTGAVAKNIIKVTNSGVNPQVFDMAANAEGRAFVAIGDESSVLRYRVLAPGGVPEGSADQLVLAKSNKVSISSIPYVAAGKDNQFCMYYVDDNSQTGKSRSVDTKGTISPTTNDLGAGNAGSSGLIGGLALAASGDGYAAAYIQPSVEMIKLDASCKKTGAAVNVFNATGQDDAAIDSIAGSPANQEVFVSGNLKGQFLQPTEETRTVVQGINLGTNTAASVELAGSKHVAESFGHIVRQPQGGEAILLWVRQKGSSTSNGCELLMRRLDETGKPQGNTFNIALQSAVHCAYFPTGAANEAGDVMISYTEFDGQNSSTTPAKVRGIIYRRLLAAPPSQ